MTMRCKAKTKKGNRCKNEARDDGYCYIPSHKEPAVKPVKLEVERYDNPPEYLNEVGRAYWQKYLKSLQGTNFTEYARLGDLCYWEQQKEQVIKALNEDGKSVFIYRKDDGTVKHIQPSAYLANLKNIQKEINALEKRLFKGVKKESKPETDKKRVVKNF